MGCRNIQWKTFSLWYGTWYEFCEFTALSKVLNYAQDYRRRFFESTNPHGHDRDANDFQFYVPNRVSIERRAAESCADSAPTRGSIPDLEKRSLEKNQLQSNDKLQTDNDAPPEPAKIPPLPHSVDAPSMPTVQAELLFREECMRIVATFLRPESSKELSLDATVRETIIRDLRTSTHPDVVS